MTVDEDSLAIQQVLAGETEAFAGIVRRHQGRLFSFARRFFRNEADREDFVQDVFLQAFRRLETYRGEARFSSWLLSIAYHEAVRTRSRMIDHAVLESESIAAPGDTPEETALKNEARSVVVGAIRELPPRFAICLDLFFFFSNSYAEIAETTGIPLNTVRSHIRRAKKLLQTALSSHTSEVCHELH